jgi:hypothetical protein
MINKSIILTCSILFSSFSNSQVTFINKKPLAVLPKQNVLFIGLDNPLEISSGGYDSVYATINNGSITHLGGGRFILRPYQVSDTAIITLTAFEKKSSPNQHGFIINKKDFQFNFKVRAIPIPHLALGGQVNEDGVVTNIKATAGVTAYLPDFYYEVKFMVDSFDIVFSGGEFETEKRHRNPGNTWDKETRDLINQSKSGTTIIIEKAVIIGPDSRRFRSSDRLQHYIK